jgi:hypothetical protein
LNMLVTSFCWSGIVWFLVVQSLEILRFTVGPLPDPLCFAQFAFKQIIHLQTVMICDAITVVRYVYLFVLKNTSGFKDEFWFLFINIWIIAFCGLTQITFIFLPGTQPLVLYICTGKNPAKDWKDGPKKNHLVSISPETTSWSHCTKKLDSFFNFYLFVKFRIAFWCSFVSLMYVKLPSGHVGHFRQRFLPNNRRLQNHCSQTENEYVRICRRSAQRQEADSL